MAESKGMHLALDLDSTITAEPEMFGSLAKAVKDAGGTVSIVHGVEGEAASDDDMQEAQTKLKANGFENLYDNLYCSPRPTAQTKAAWCKQNDVDLLIDNRRKNAKATAANGVPAAHFLAT